MRGRLIVILVLVFSATSLFAKELWIAASGTANGIFFSDARVFNPNDKDITIQAYYLPRGNVNNSGARPLFTGKFIVACARCNGQPDLFDTSTISAYASNAPAP